LVSTFGGVFTLLLWGLHLAAKAQAPHQLLRQHPAEQVEADHRRHHRDQRHGRIFAAQVYVTRRQLGRQTSVKNIRYRPDRPKDATQKVAQRQARKGCLVHAKGSPAGKRFGHNPR
jgi:hypothetical protein